MLVALGIKHAMRMRHVFHLWPALLYSILPHYLINDTILEEKLSNIKCVLIYLPVLSDWRERRLISKLYMDQRVKVRLDRGETRSVQIGRRVRQGCCLSPILFNVYSKCLNKEALDWLGDLNFGGQIIQTVKYADELVLMAKEETVLDGVIDKLIEIGKCYGMEMNVKKTKVMRISRQPSPVKIMTYQKNWRMRNVLNIWVAY